IHPKWNKNFDESLGYDFTIVKLTEPVTDAGPQPALYNSDNEIGQLLTFMGYGTWGYGSKGEMPKLNTHNELAAAFGLIEDYHSKVTPFPQHGDAGNYFC